MAADDLLGRLADQEGQEPLRRGLVLAGLQHRGARDVQDVARIMRREMGDLRVHGPGADLGPQPVPVVLVDDAQRRAALVHVAGDGLVVRVEVPGRVGLQGAAASSPWRRSPCARSTEVTIGWKSVSPGGQGELALVLRVGELHDRGGQLALADQAGVVDDHADPGGHAHPVALRRVVLGRGGGQRAAVAPRPAGPCPAGTPAAGSSRCRTRRPGSGCPRSRSAGPARPRRRCAR